VDGLAKNLITMTNLDIELKLLKEAIIEMTDLVTNQVVNANEAFLSMDTDLAYEIQHNEQKINALELSIDRDCEHILALFNPVASDLRFVLAVLKSNADLERIGDYTYAIAGYVIEHNKSINKELIEASQIIAMFDTAISMLRDIKIAFETEDVKLAKKVYSKDADLNMINKQAADIISKFLEKDGTLTTEALYLFSTIRKLERVGDHVKNMVEVLIFYVKAKVLKHKDIKDKKK
jgi:phosphate transport system protein